MVNYGYLIGISGLVLSSACTHNPMNIGESMFVNALVKEANKLAPFYIETFQESDQTFDCDGEQKTRAEIYAGSLAYVNQVHANKDIFVDDACEYHRCEGSDSDVQGLHDPITSEIIIGESARISSYSGLDDLDFVVIGIGLLIHEGAHGYCKFQEDHGSDLEDALLNTSNTDDYREGFQLARSAQDPVYGTSLPIDMLSWELVRELVSNIERNINQRAEWIREDYGSLDALNSLTSDSDSIWFYLGGRTEKCARGIETLVFEVEDWGQSERNALRSIDLHEDDVYFSAEDNLCFYLEDYAEAQAADKLGLDLKW